MTAITCQMKLNQTTIVSLGLLIAAIFGAGFGTGTLVQRQAQQQEIAEANRQNAVAWQFAAHADREKWKTLSSAMQYVQNTQSRAPAATEIAISDAAEVESP